jgi:hypothetical protein
MMTGTGFIQLVPVSLKEKSDFSLYFVWFALPLQAISKNIEKNEEKNDFLCRVCHSDGIVRKQPSA